MTVLVPVSTVSLVGRCCGGRYPRNKRLQEIEFRELPVNRAKLDFIIQGFSFHLRALQAHRSYHDLYAGHRL